MDRSSKSRGPAADLGAHRPSPDHAAGEGAQAGPGAFSTQRWGSHWSSVARVVHPTFARTSCAWAAATPDLVVAVEDPAQGPLELSNGAPEQSQVSEQPLLILLTKDAALRLERGRGPTALVPKVQFPHAGESLARLNEVLQVDFSTDERTHMHLRHCPQV